MRRLVAGAGVTAGLVCAGVLSLPLRGQQATAAIGANTPMLVVTAYNGGPPIPYTVPRTPWGDPDFQGVWSSDDTANIPTSRPATFGERLYMTDEEFTTRQQQVARGVQGGESAEGSFRGDFARRAFRQTSTIVDPPDGRQPAATQEARKRAAPRDQGTFGNGPFESVEDFTLYDRCVTRGVWGSVMRVVYGNGNRIVQAPGMVAISYEMIHDSRVFYTDGRPRIGDAIRQYLGSSRARWDGDVLVVETTNFTDKTSIGPNGNGLRHSAQMRIVEKFKRVANDVLQYQITVDDPVTYGRQFTASLPLTPLDGGTLLPYDCHEGNLAVRQSLGAERLEDAAVAADLAKGVTRDRRPVQDGLDVGGRPTAPRGGGAGSGGGAGAGRGQ